jgi:hypothetical protein
MVSYEGRRMRLRRLIDEAGESDKAIAAALAAMADTLDDLNARIDRLEGEVVSMAGTLPWTDGEEGRSDETSA